MNIPTTIAELRANVAACPTDTTFNVAMASSCLVTRPLNLGTDTYQYAYYPGDNLFLAPQGTGINELPNDLSILAGIWDFDQHTDAHQTRDQALAWIDAYVAAHEGEASA